MDNLEDLIKNPRHVRYDFFISVIGTILIGFGGYYLFYLRENLFGNLLVFLGLPMIIWGYFEMFKNYKQDIETVRLDNAVRKVDSIKKLKNLGLISEKEKKGFLKRIRRTI